ncbi:1677_t:CDS:1 [Dentiscutata erythropus]|uniref:1677_t:CDS:1 n=1 Tax=Dentiscutata erythropus TaxID=1348616 RepID=A0A9N9HK61_9GLOM|nr:1677_t:CDS:1 [Dentiscutata erythropus]
MSDSDIESYVQKPTYKFLGTRTPLRSEICPSPVVAGLREKYEGLRESLNPLHEVAKKAAYIDTLIYLLREQGFEFHQSLDGEHQLIDLIGRKKVKIKVIDDSNAEDDTDGGINEDNDSNEIDETQDTIKLTSSSRKRMMHFNTTHEKTCNGNMVKTNKKIAISKDDETVVKTNPIKGIITKNYNGTVRRPPIKYSQTKPSYTQKDISRHDNSSKKHMINMKSTNKKLYGTPAPYVPPDLAYVEVPSISAALKAMYIKV